MKRLTVPLLLGISLLFLYQRRAQGGELKAIIGESARKYGVPPSLLYGICMAESSCDLSLLNKNHYKRGSSFGLFGLTRIAVKDVGVNYDRLKSLPGLAGIKAQAETAAKYLAKLKRTYNGKFGIRSWKDAVQAYNVGIGNFKKGVRNRTYLSKVLTFASQY